MEVKLVAWLPEGEEILAAGASSTRSGEDTYEILKDFHPELMKFIDYAIKLHLSSVLDFPFAIITFSDVSRVFTHQLVRHRLAAYMQQSMRFVKIHPKPSRRYVPWYVVPPSIARSDTETIASFLLANERAGEKYRALTGRGVPVEDARFVLPNGVKTHITMAADAEEWLHVIAIRASQEAQWEIRRASLAALFALSLVYPHIFGKIRVGKNTRAVKLVPKNAPTWVYRALLKKTPEKIAIALEEEGRYVLEADGKSYVLTPENTDITWLGGSPYSLPEARRLVRLSRKWRKQWDGRELTVDLTDEIGTLVEEEKEIEAAEVLKEHLGWDIESVDLSHRVIVRIRGLAQNTRSV